MKWFFKCLGPDYANFEGRARRKEYWYFMLFSFILLVVANILDMLLFGPTFTPIKWLLSLYMIVPQLSVMVRRLHDIGRGGAVVVWYYALGFIWFMSLFFMGFSSMLSVLNSGGGSLPVGLLVLLCGGGLVFLVWGIVFLVWYCTPGMQGENKYGPDPKAE